MGQLCTKNILNNIFADLTSFTPVLHDLGFYKQEMEIEESNTVVASFLRTRGIGFGAIKFQSL